MANLDLLLLQLLWWNSQSVAVAEEQDTLALTGGVGTGLNPLAPTCAGPHRPDESNGTVLDIGAVVLAHDWLDGLGGLIGIVEWDGADVVMEDMGLDDSVKELASNETEFTINGSGGTTGKVPAVGLVVRKGWVSVLKEGDGN